MREKEVRPGQGEINPGTIEPEETRIPIVRSLEEIEALENPEEIGVIHLSRYKALTVKAIKRLTELYTSLTAVQIPPGQLKNNLSKKAKIILEEKGIELQIINRKYIHLLPGTEIIKSIDDINELRNPNEVKIVRLSRQKAVKINTIKELLVTCPNLTIVSVAPNIAGRVLSPEAKELLAGKDIELQIKRLGDLPPYNYQSPAIRRNYLIRKEIYEDFFMNPEREEQRQLLFLLNEHGFDVVEMAEMYFGEETMTIGKIAEEKGLKYYKVQKNIAALLYLIGYPSSDPNVSFRSRGWLRKFKKAVEEEAWLENYQVGKIQPPKTLSPSRREMWQKIMQFRKENPGEWSHFKKNSRSHHGVLVNFFQLDDKRGEIIRVEQIARKYNITEQKVSHLKKIALKNLGLLESEE